MTRFRMLIAFFLITSCLASGALADADYIKQKQDLERKAQDLERKLHQMASDFLYDLSCGDLNYPYIDYRFAPFERACNNGDRVSGWWTIEEGKAPIDDSPGVIAINWSAFRSNRPTAIGARCIERETSILVTFDLGDDLVNDGKSFDITYRIDSAHAQSTRWSAKNDKIGLFGANAEAFLRNLQHAKKIFIRLTEKNGQRHDAVFKLAGIQEVIETVAKACGWSPLDLTRDDYRAIQTLLNAGGFKAGTPDGAWGKASRNAMRAFQKQNGLPVTGSPDQETLKALGFQPGGE